MDETVKALMACPLDRVWVPGHYGAPVTPEKPGLRLERTTPVTLLQLSLFPGQEKQALTALKTHAIKAFPDAGEAQLHNKQSIYSLGAMRYLLESDHPELPAVLTKTISTDIGSVTDLSSARTVLTISGPDVSRVLAKGIAIDFHLQNFPIGKVAQTSIHHMPIIIVRTGEDEFRLFTFSSYAESTLHWLETASRDHGFERV